MSEAFAAAEPLLAEHAQIEAQLADPAVHADAANARKLGRRYAELGQVAQAYTAWKAASDDADAARELAEVDESFAAELPSLQQAADAAGARLREVLIPRDPDDSRDGQGRGGVDPGDPGVRSGRADRVGVQDVRRAVHQVVGVERMAGDVQGRALVGQGEADDRVVGALGQVAHSSPSSSHQALRALPSMAER